ncbi:hypothetical protein C3L33_21182, partial [Rhododendron williamsianum]
MPSTDHQGSSVPFASFRRPILSLRSDQVHSMEPNHDSDARDSELESFQKQVCSRFHDLSAVTADEFLSAAWIQKRTIGEGQFRRARKALMDLALVMLDEKETGSVFSQRNRSFGRHNTSKDHHHRQPGHSRSLSWSVSRSCPHFYNELFADVCAVDSGCSDPLSGSRPPNPLYIPPAIFMGSPLLLLHDRIMDESKKRERRNSNGLLKEIYQMEKCIRQMTDLVDSIQFPLTEEQREEVEKGVNELGMVFDACKNGLNPLEREVREVFRKIMSCRTEGLELLSRGNTSG